MTKQQTMCMLSSSGDESHQDEPRNIYIWGFQQHFWIEVKVRAEQLFKALDDRIVPDTFIVAINCEKGNEHPFAVVEPEDHEFQPDDFKNILTLVAQLEKVSPDPSFGYPAGSKQGEIWAQGEKRRMFRSRVRDAITQTIEAMCQHERKKVYVSPGRELGPYIIHSVLLIDEAVYNSHPLLRKTTHETSLIGAVAKKFVHSCWEAILGSFAGQGHVAFPEIDTLLRSAGASFMFTPFSVCGQLEGLHGGFETCVEISTLTYEKAIGHGRLILARAAHENVTESLSFRNPPKLRNYRAVRKLLQLTGKSEGLICDSVDVVGIGSISGNYNATNEDLFCVEFVGHSKWELTHGGNTLMRVEHGIPQLPKKREQVRRFGERFSRVFPHTDDKHRTAMERHAAAAAELSHGAILIVAENAADEAARFGSQCTMIEPQPFSKTLLEKASRIDGAILIAPKGLCYAIGVILDGQVNDKGTAERGARFNSTVRYVLGSKAACLGLVVSDDGMINIVPDYRPLMSISEIEQKLDLFREAVNQAQVNQRTMNRLTKWIKAHEFYLSDVQCNEVNQLISAAEPKSDKSAAWLLYRQFARNPDMNDTFLRD